MDNRSEIWRGVDAIRPRVAGLAAGLREEAGLVEHDCGFTFDCAAPQDFGAEAAFVMVLVVEELRGGNLQVQALVLQFRGLAVRRGHAHCELAGRIDFDPQPRRLLCDL